MSIGVAINKKSLNSSGRWYMKSSGLIKKKPPNFLDD